MTCLAALPGCIQEDSPAAMPTILKDEAIVLPPPPARALTVGIYNCIDTTGQRRPTGEPQELSTAVPLDCTPYLIAAIRSLRPGYVYLVERQHVDELLRERQIATLALNAADATAASAQATAQNSGSQLAPAPQPTHRLATLRVAEVLLVGQVVAYDRATKEISGGLAINGTGGDGTLVTDLITFSLRAVAVQTGEILGEKTATKSITSLKVGGHTTRIFTTSVLDVELGGAGNEAVGLALSAAVHNTLGALITQGIHDGWWAS
jgi:curli production assembly/transport component CsgG